MFRKRKSLFIWTAAVLAVTSSQLVILQQLNAFLKPPQMQTVKAAGAPVQTPAPGTEEKEVSIPKDAVRYIITPDRKGIAYIKHLPNSQKLELVVENGKGVISRQSVDKVTHMEWLGESNTLLYMVDKGGKQELYLLQMQHKEPLLIDEWAGKTRTIKTVFFSPYLEFFYIQVRNGSKTEIYKYTYSTGLTELPVQDIRIDHVSYDEKLDILYIANLSGEHWQYKNGGLRDKNGKLVAADKQVKLPQEVLQKEANKQVKREGKGK
ncbi:hypothetical protein [Aneurinibacillus tyrosinisolvens]|uniref:hypothetical protein n=1 Tax=Aneurinibacillus tyrosinisolvens TaxID=1443435 RepID=UPI00063F1BC8|nr:hypothetical protein [Aneurinibacillus tyrosinisolvens]